MSKQAIFQSMIIRYNAVAFTHMYVYGFIDRGNVYMAYVDASAMPYLLKLDRASRGAGYSLRFRPTRAQKELLKTYKCEILCSVAFFKDMVANSKHNKGEIFEKLVTEKFGQEWHKDNTPFTEDGDITVNGVAYQIKFQNATFCNEKTLANLA